LLTFRPKVFVELFLIGSNAVPVVIYNLLRLISQLENQVGSRLSTILRYTALAAQIPLGKTLVGVYLAQIVTMCLDTPVNLSACSVLDADKHNLDDFLRIAFQIVVPGILRTLHKPLVADLRVFQLCVLFDIGQPQPVELILFHEGLCHVSGVILAYQLYTVCQTRLGVHSDGTELFIVL
jgi:hypothetical protein